MLREARRLPRARGAAAGAAWGRAAERARRGGARGGGAASARRAVVRAAAGARDGERLPGGLFNGDVGVVLPEAEDGDAAKGSVLFGRRAQCAGVAPSRLPPHETVFAMTVHKAQGSEFDEVAVVLPGEARR